MKIARSDVANQLGSARPRRRSVWAVVSGTALLVLATTIWLWPNADERRLLGTWYVVSFPYDGPGKVQLHIAGSAINVDREVSEPRSWSVRDGLLNLIAWRPKPWWQFYKRFWNKQEDIHAESSYVVQWIDDETVRLDEVGSEWEIYFFRSRSDAEELAARMRTGYLKEHPGEAGTE